jgi:hypothetical protein
MSDDRETSAEWIGVDGIERKIVFEPDGNGEHFRAEYERLGDWRLIGRNPLPTSTWTPERQSPETWCLPTGP